MTFREQCALAASKWKEQPRACLEAFDVIIPTTPGERLYLAQEKLVYGEWNERFKADLPMYHSIDVNDVHFKFKDTQPHFDSCDEVGGDYLGYTAFARKDYVKAESIWQLSANPILRQFRIENDTKDPSEWAAVEHLTPWRARGKGALVWLGCDAKYFVAFGAVLVKSLNNHNAQVHVHIMDPQPEAIELAKNLGCSFSTEKCNGDRIYYHAARLKRFSDDLKRFKRPMWFLDVDAIANKNPVDIPIDGLAMRLRPGRIEPWNQFNASMIGADESCIPYFEAVAGWLGRRRSAWFWGIDQLALFCVYHAMKPKLRCLTHLECDYDYQEKGTIWNNSGASKFTEDPTRGKYNEHFARLKDSLSATRGSGGTTPGQTAEHGIEYVTISSGPAEPSHPSSRDEAIRWVREAAREAKIQEMEEPPPFRQRKIGKFIYLPVEISGRELGAKCALAGQLVKKGFQVLIGASWNMAHQKWGDLPPGIVLFKTMNSIDAKLIWQAGCAGHITAVMNEELISLVPEEWLYKANCNKWAMEMIDAVFAHGPKSAEIYRKLGAKNKTVISGSARANEAHGGSPSGDIVLCSNAATINSITDFKQYVRRAFEIMATPLTEDVIGIQENLVKAEWDARELLLQTARLLKEKYPTRFKFRPHPAEWRPAYDEFKDCLDQPGSFSERLKQTAVVVFASGCGTGTEAFNAGVPSVRVGDGGMGLSRELGVGANDVDACLSAVAALLERPENRGSLAHHFSSNTVAEKLTSLYNRYQYPMEFSIPHAWKARKVEFEPSEFNEAKFPPISCAEVSGMIGRPAQEISWRMWAVSP